MVAGTTHDNDATVSAEFTVDITWPLINVR